MKTLLILRHGKSDWSHLGVPDDDRPLNKRGRRDAPRIGRLLLDEEMVPDLILTSPARRARETATLVAQACAFDGEIAVWDELYPGDPADHLAVLRRQDDTHRCILLVAHNPGLESLLDLLAGRQRRLPTAALAQVSLAIRRWSELRPGVTGELEGVWEPKGLE